MKVLIASTPATGHLNPLLAIGRILMAEGHEVAGLSANAMRGRIEEIGAAFHPFPAGADFDMRSIPMEASAAKHLAPLPEQVRARRERIFVAPVPAQHEGLQQALREFPADVVIADDLFFGVLPMLLGPRARGPRSSCAARRSCTGAVRTGRRSSPACRRRPPRLSSSNTRPSPRSMTGSSTGRSPSASTGSRRSWASGP